MILHMTDIDLNIYEYWTANMDIGLSIYGYWARFMDIGLEYKKQYWVMLFSIASAIYLYLFNSL
ncbi:hypothetical protein KUTeg_007144 [Tegillarca granosa]|uniref:NADH dehydrogenase subunit 5 n=1 Tax=Tegillarca granosa TaxID=220873 RepID=A0ABQ9FCD7_TEGGR|nr:hypothetical protein KUTeg_007144 [Tegillarca granosa]